MTFIIPTSRQHLICFNALCSLQIHKASYSPATHTLGSCHLDAFSKTFLNFRFKCYCLKGSLIFLQCGHTQLHWSGEHVLTASPTGLLQLRFSFWIHINDFRTVGLSIHDEYRKMFCSCCCLFRVGT